MKEVEKEEVHLQSGEAFTIGNGGVIQMEKEKVNEMDVKLNPYLPTAQVIRGMGRSEFSRWINQAQQELPRRAEKRDPLYHLQKRIFRTLERKDLSEEQREAIVLSDLEVYERVTSQPQRAKLT